MVAETLTLTQTVLFGLDASADASILPEGGTR